MRTKTAVGLAALAGAAGLVWVVRERGRSDLETVEHVDLERYLGTWYEIASIPNRFQRGCVATQATYSLRGDGTIRVDNRCRDETPDGPERRAIGRAWPVDASHAKLEVQFFWPFRGDYWILELGDDYEYAVVGEPRRRYLWILAREPELDDAVYSRLVRRAEAHGYDVSDLELTPQPPRRSSR